MTDDRAVKLRDGKRARVTARGLVLAFLGVVGGLVLLAAAGFGYLAISLKNGPIDAPFIAREIEARLEESFGKGVDFSLGAARIEDSESGPVLAVDRLVVRDARGAVVVSSPKALVAVSLMPLLGGTVAPRRLELVGIDLRLDRLEDGSVVFAAGADDARAIPIGIGGGTRPAVAPPPEVAAAAPSDAPVDAPPNAPANAPPKSRAEGAAELVGALLDLATSSESAIGSLERFGVSRGRLTVTDRVSGVATTFEGVEIAFDRPAAGRASLRLSALGPNGRWSISARASGEADAARKLEVDVAELSLDEIALVAGFRERPVDFDMPISAKLAFELGPDRQVAGATGRFTLGAGLVKLDDPDHEPFLIDEAVGGFRWDPQARVVIVEPTQLNAGQTQISVEGRIAPPAVAGEAWAISLASRDNVLGAERPGDKPLSLGRLVVEAQYAPAATRFAIDRFEVAGGDVALSLTCEIVGGETGPNLKLALQASRMSARGFVRLWPSFIASETRAWFLRSLKGGVLEQASLRVDLDGEGFRQLRAEQPPPDQSVALDFTLSDATLDYLPDAPPLTGVTGEGKVTGRAAVFSAKRAQVDLANGRKLTVPEATFTAPDFAQKPAPATLAIRAQGSVEAAMEFLAKPAFRAYADLPPQAQGARGQLDARIDIALKLGPPETRGDKPEPAKARARNAPDVSVRVQAQGAGVTLDGVLGGEKFENGALSISADAANLLIKGDGKILGAPAQLELKKGAGQGGDAVVSMTLDEAQRARMGLNAAGVSGPVAVRLAAPLDAKGKTRRAQVDVDFVRASLDGLVPGFSKSSGKPAKASFALIEADGGYTLDNLNFDGAGASVRGSAHVGGDGKFQWAKLSQVRLSPGDDLKVDATRGGDGLKLVARGAAFDARPFMRAMSASAGEAAPKDFDLDLKTTLLTGHNLQAIANAELRLVRAGGRPRTMQLAGRFGRDPVTVGLAQSADGFVFQTQDAGAALGFLDIYKRMEGGRLSGGVRFDQERIDASFTIRDFVLRDEPGVRRLVAESAAIRNDGGKQVDTRTVQFQKLQARLTRAGQRLVIHDAVMSGSSIGLTVEGDVDLRSERIQLSGAFVPAYGINNFFAKLPLFGPILGGGSNEGLFAVNYRASGTMSAPAVSVNPLSAIAPGFLRKIFGAIDAGQEAERSDVVSDTTPAPAATRRAGAKPAPAKPQAPARAAPAAPLQLGPAR
ncbi:MAG: hypothetical protein IPL88_13155 [Rhizobiales bacterium]|nr:hypothetical protein [Hyphomicrobiales bacterium]